MLVCDGMEVLMQLRRLVVALMLLLPLVAHAANTSISNGDGGAATRAILNKNLNQVFNVMQPPYNAVNNGIVDDTTAIQNAINDALDAGGGTIYFPAGTSSNACYKITSSLVFTHRTSDWYPINLVGEGMGHGGTYGSNLCSFFGGTTQNVTGTASGTGGVIRLTVASSAAFATGNWVRVQGVGGTIEANYTWAITVVDGTHIELNQSTWANAWTSGGTIALPGFIIDAKETAGRNLHSVVNLALTGGTAYQGSTAGIRWGGGITGTIQGVKIATCLMGVDISSNAFNYSIQDSIINGCGDNQGIGAYISQNSITNSSFTGLQYGIINNNVGSVICGNRFEVNGIAVVIGANPAFDATGSHGTVLCGNSYERNSIGVFIRSGDTINIQGETITVPFTGPGIGWASASWAAGTATVTLAKPHGLSGAVSCFVEGSPGSSSPWDAGSSGGMATCTFSGVLTMTYPLAVDPGSASYSTAQVSFLPSAGIYTCHVSYLNIAGTSINAAVGWDRSGLYLAGCGGTGAHSYNKVSASNIQSYTAPPAISKAGWIFSQVQGAPGANLSMVFADLPGQTGVVQTPALKGMVYDITNCSIAAGWGSAVTSGGGGGTACRVYYNGSGWTAMGQ